MRRPEVIAFDVVETLFALDGLRPRLAAAGLPEALLETWFAELLRDAFALETAGLYRPFREVASSALAGHLEPGADLQARIDGVLDGFTQLDPHPDVAPAMRAARDAGIRIVTLTNGSEKVTRALLERAGLLSLVEHVVSIDEIGHWKPNRAVYLHCATRAGIAPDRLALVAAHGWDVQGARRAGLATGYVARDGGPFPPAMEKPDVQAASLTEVVAALIAAPAG